MTNKTGCVLIRNKMPIYLDSDLMTAEGLIDGQSIDEEYAKSLLEVNAIIGLLNIQNMRDKITQGAIEVNINQYLLDDNNLHEKIGEVRIAKPVSLNSGLRFSAQASSAHFCTPKNNHGPWSHIEVHSISQEIPAFLSYAKNSQDYRYVPVEIVDEIIERNGGIKKTTKDLTRE